jgi:hypothetical protein
MNEGEIEEILKNYLTTHLSVNIEKKYKYRGYRDLVIKVSICLGETVIAADEFEFLEGEESRPNEY